MLMPQLMPGATIEDTSLASHQQSFSHSLNVFCVVSAQIYLRPHSDLHKETDIAKIVNLSQDHTLTQSIL